MQLFTDRVRVAGKTTIEDLIVLHSQDIEVQMTRSLPGARNEADIRNEFAALLRNFIIEAQLAVAARHEYALAGGKIDTKYGGVILEPAFAG